jgi:hypothetical protein
MSRDSASIRFKAYCRPALSTAANTMLKPPDTTPWLAIQLVATLMANCLKALKDSQHSFCLSSYHVR